MERGLERGAIRGREAVGREATALTWEGGSGRGNKGAAEETGALDRFGESACLPPNSSALFIS